MIRKSFGRSLSYPTPPTVPKLKGRGSTSLPTRFHPFLSTLSDHTHDLLTWHHSHSQTRPDWILDGLSRIDRLHCAALDDLLQHPRVHCLLRRRSPWTGRLLEDFLRFADVYSSFRSAIFALKDRYSETQIAIRRKKEEKIAPCLKNQRRAEKELIRISWAAARNLGRWGLASEDDIEEAVLAGVVKDAVGATAAATAAVILAVAEMSASAVVSAGMTSSIKGSCIVGSMCRLNSKKKEVKEREEEGDLMEFIGEVERRSGRLLRSFVNTRVFLLNVLTPSS